MLDMVPFTSFRVTKDGSDSPPPSIAWPSFSVAFWMALSSADRITASSESLAELGLPRWRKTAEGERGQECGDH